MRPSAKILVAEANGDLQRLLVVPVAAAGYDTISAARGSEALALAKQQIPDLIFLGPNLVDMAGAEVCQSIKSEPNLGDTPVVEFRAPAASPATSYADSSLELPIGNSALLALVQAFLRCKSLENRLRRSEQLWQMVFAKTRDAVLLIDSGLFITDVNPRALELYEYSLEELKRRHVSDLFPEGTWATFETRFKLMPYGLVFYTTQRRKSGSLFAAEVQARKFRTEGRTAFELLVWNRDEEARVQIESRALEREIDLLAAYSEGGRSVTAAVYGGGPLSQDLPAYFAQLVQDYGAIVDLGIEERTYQVNRNLSEQLRHFAMRLASLRASPRDVTQLHAAALKQKLLESSARKRQAYNDEGRFMLIQLLGHLASHYRDYALGALGTRSDG